MWGEVMGMVGAAHHAVLVSRLNHLNNLVRHTTHRVLPSYQAEIELPRISHLCL